MNPELQEHLQNYEFNDNSLAICLLHYQKGSEVPIHQIELLGHYIQEQKKAVYKDVYSRKIRALLQRISRDKIIEHIQKQKTDSASNIGFF